MNEITIVLLIVLPILALLAGVFFGYLYGMKRGERSASETIQKELEASRSTAQDILERADREAKDLKKNALLDAKEEIQKWREEIERELKKDRDENKKFEERLEKREEYLNGRDEQISSKEESLNSREELVHQNKVEVETILEKQKEMLMSIANLSPDEAREIVFQETSKQYEHDLAQMFKEIKTGYEEEAERHAQWVVATAIQRYAADYVNEGTVSTVALPSDDMKGRIIGREGRNIRAFEKATGTDLIIDDTPEVVVVSCFNTVRREIARITLEKLIADGRIHPAHIEDMYEKAKADVIRVIKDEGQRAVFETGVRGIDHELLKLLGRLRFRTSFGQNVLEHSIEVARLAGLMASELELNADRAKRGALLHDIGKAVDHEVEGSHAVIGGELAKRYGERADIINMIQYHHGEVEATCPESVIIAAADALSAARPGARRETLDIYIKRLQQLEEIANSHDSVEKSYAIQAGRELRIIVLPDKIDDMMADKLAYDVSKEVEAKMEYPGQVKVTVIREKRSIAYAR